MRCVCAGEGAGELGKHIRGALEHDPAWSFGSRHDALTGLEPGGPQGIGGNRDLMLGTDPSRPAAALLYFFHNSKG